MTNAATPYFRDGRQFPSDKQFADAMDAYDALRPLLGDDPNAIAQHLGWTGGTAAVIRRMANERRSACR